MRFTIRALLIFQIVLWVMLAIGPVEKAYACSGRPAPFDSIVEHTDYVVKATVVETDELGQNYILEAETYLAGGAGPKYLLLALNHPILIQGVLEDLYGGGDCNGLFRGLSVGESAYLFVYRREDGSYGTASGPLFNPVFYPSVSYYEDSGEKAFNIYLTDEEGQADEGHSLTEAEFINLIAERTGDLPATPQPDTPYPLKAPLLLSTVAESFYLLPVDGQPPVRIESDSWLYSQYVISRYHGSCHSLNCYSTSPNGLYNALQREENEIVISTYDRGEAILTGQGFLFSTTNTTMAVWNDPNLEIYLLRQAGDGMREFPRELVNSVSLEVRPAHIFQSFNGVAIWSADGRFLAFSDAAGLWLWDVYTPQNEPRLLLSTSENGDVPVADYFSPTGRYLAFSQGDTRETLDLIFGNRYPYGVFSPNEANLVPFDPAATDNPLLMCSLTPYECKQLIGRDVRQVTWKNNEVATIVICGDSVATCLIQEVPVLQSAYAREILVYDDKGSMFAYNPRMDAQINLVDGCTLILRYPYGEFTNDYCGVLDGYILSMEWALPLFYYAN